MEARRLTALQLRAILAKFQARPRVDGFRIVEPADRPSYLLDVGGSAYVLRISEPRRPERVAFEARLLVHLNDRGLRVPRPLRSRTQPKGALLVPLSSERKVGLFRGVEGRRIGVFELRPRHLGRIGEALARLHNGMAELPKPAAGYDDTPVAEALSRLERALKTRRLPRRHAEAVARCRAEHDANAGLRLSLLPHGTICGQLDYDALRFGPRGEVGFSELGFVRRGAFIEDLAAALLTWAWRPSATQQGGPAGDFDLERARALLIGYQLGGPLKLEERARLPRLLRALAAERAALCMARHELRSQVDRPYADYRQHFARLGALDAQAADLEEALA